METFSFWMSACRRKTLLLSTDDPLDILCQMVFSREICFEWHLMSETPYLAWLLTREDTLRLSPLEGCGGRAWLGQTQFLVTAQAEVGQGPCSSQPCPG